MSSPVPSSPTSRSKQSSITWSQRIVEIMPVNAAGVSLITEGSAPRYVAASNGPALDFERLQSEMGEGPCIAAFLSGEAVAVPDIEGDRLFPHFAPRAARMGLGGVFAFPLREGEERLGALDLYRDEPGMLDEHTMTVAQTLADVASAYVLNAQARTELRDAKDRFRETSLHDALTALPNRILLSQRLEHAILRARRSGKKVAILFVDMDRFKEVNDTFGHDVGDRLLVAVSARLSGLLRPGDTLARMSGDEFVILCEDLDDASVVDILASRIHEALADAFSLADHAIQISSERRDRLLGARGRSAGEAPRGRGRSHVSSEEQGGSASSDPRPARAWLDQATSWLGARPGRGVDAR